MSKATNAIIPTLAIVADNARKQATQKPANTRPATVKADVITTKLLTKEEAITLIIPRLANNINVIASAKEAGLNIRADIKELQKAGIKIGSVKNEPVAMALQEAFRACFNSKGQPLSTGTVNNYMSAVRKALKEGKPLELNGSRAKANANANAPAKKAAKTTWSTHGEVIAALAKAILSVKSNCSDTLWSTAMANCPADMADLLDDFLDAQEASEETEYGNSGVMSIDRII